MGAGLIPVWASEIEPFSIRVTKARFPEMLHVGDITRLSGEELPPVDIVCGGSPCQDLSSANFGRSGLQGERSALFFEQIRVIKELRKHDKSKGREADAIRPRYMVWENVPGAFSSAGGKDFQTVLEETCRIADGNVSVPRPPGGVWKSAGAILGDQFSVAWRIYDAQYWGLAQRRRRIFLVADFGGHTAPKILFEQDRLFGDSAPSGEAWQGTAGNVEACAGTTGCSVDCHTIRAGVAPSVIMSFEPGATSRLGGHFNYNLCSTLRADAGDNRTAVVIEHHPQDGRCKINDSGIVQTLTSHIGTGGNNVPLLYVLQSNMIGRGAKNGPNGSGINENLSFPLTATDRHVVVFENHQHGGYRENQILGTIRASGGSNGGGSENLVVKNKYHIRRLTPLECLRLQGFPDWWFDNIHSYSDTVGYKALGNSVAIPCAQHVLRGIAYFLNLCGESQ